MDPLCATAKLENQPIFSRPLSSSSSGLMQEDGSDSRRIDLSPNHQIDFPKSLHEHPLKESIALGDPSTEQSYARNEYNRTSLGLSSTPFFGDQYQIGDPQYLNSGFDFLSSLHKSLPSENTAYWNLPYDHHHINSLFQGSAPAVPHSEDFINSGTRLLANKKQPQISRNTQKVGVVVVYKLDEDPSVKVEENVQQKIEYESEQRQNQAPVMYEQADEPKMSQDHQAMMWENKKNNNSYGQAFARPDEAPLAPSYFRYQIPKLLPKYAPTLETRVLGLGGITKQQRQRKIALYIEKRKKRTYTKKISYDCRKKVADQRIRVKGRFVTKEQALTLLKVEDKGFSPDDIKRMLKAQTKQHDRILRLDID